MSKFIFNNKTSIDCGCNNIGAKGAEGIAEALKGNNTLTNINLESNKIGAKGAKAIAEALKVNKQRIIDICNVTLKKNNLTESVEEKKEEEKSIMAEYFVSNIKEYFDNKKFNNKSHFLDDHFNRNELEEILDKILKAPMYIVDSWDKQLFTEKTIPSDIKDILVNFVGNPNETISGISYANLITEKSIENNDRGNDYFSR